MGSALIIYKLFALKIQIVQMEGNAIKINISVKMRFHAD